MSSSKQDTELRGTTGAPPEPQEQTPAPAPEQPAGLAKQKESIINEVMGLLGEMQSEGGIHFPANYSPQNALRSAWLILQETIDINKRPVLDVCTRGSISRALLNTVIMGLSPAKKQVYYIAYGKQLTAMRSYFGTMAIARRLGYIEDIRPQAVYEDDTFRARIVNGAYIIDEHVPGMEMDPEKIRGAYCTIIMKDGRVVTDYMSMPRIKRSWKKAQSAKVQNEYPDEMAMRTVVNHALKPYVNAGDDSDLLIEAFNATDAQDAADKVIDGTYHEQANRTPLPAPNAAMEMPNLQPQRQPEPVPVQNKNPNQRPSTVIQGTATISDPADDFPPFDAGDDMEDPFR